MARFAHLIESDGPGGAERMVVGLAAAQQGSGHETLVIVPAGGEGWIARELAGTGVRIEPFHLDRPWSPAFASWLADVLRRHRVSVAHSHEFTMAVYGSWAARRAGVPHVFTMHGGRYYAGRWQRRVALRVGAMLSGAVVAVSKTLRGHLSRDLWMRARRITTIPNGARLTPGSRTQLRQELRLEADDQLAVAVGNLYPVKGHGHLLDAFAALAPRFPRLHVAIAGRGELERPLRARAHALGVADRFHLLGLRPDVGSVLAAADLFVLPSLSEGVPVAVLEAMLAGRPVIASAVGDVPAVLDGGRAGVLVPPGHAEPLADAIAALLYDPTEAHRLAAAGAARAAREYTLERMVERYSALYGSLQAATSSPDPRLQSREVPATEATVSGEGA